MTTFYMLTFIVHLLVPFQALGDCTATAAKYKKAAEQKLGAIVQVQTVCKVQKPEQP